MGASGNQTQFLSANPVKYSYCLVAALVLLACSPNEHESFYQVPALVESDAVHADPEMDAADDPAIWVHPLDSSRSIIFGSNKTYGIDAYDLGGKRLQSYEVGRINNIDVLYGFALNDSTKIDILAGTERIHNQILVFQIDAESGELTEISGGILSEQPEVYGFCLYGSPGSGKTYALLNDKNGTIEQWELQATGQDSIQGKLTRQFSVETQPEGMVADHVEGFLYVGEENRGIWRFNLEDSLLQAPYFLPQSGKSNPYLSFDIEGLALYAKQDKKFLLASSQGNNSYAIFAVQEGYPHLGSFQLSTHGSIDGTEETDGIAISSQNFGKPYEEGIFVAQDGNNSQPTGSKVAQNFKWTAWTAIEQMLQIE